jgi:acetyl-CoA synthetase
MMEDPVTGSLNASGAQWLVATGRFTPPYVASQGLAMGRAGTVTVTADDDGAIWLLGRVDDVMLVSGHNISTTEVESALVSHPAVAEAAVVGATDATTGQGIVAFVILRSGIDSSNDLLVELRNHVAKEIGPIAKPRQIMAVAELPKTRSGKIMRRLLRDIAENRTIGDATTLADPNVMKLISEGLSTAGSDD